jgi:hypothetical protein
VSGRIGRRHQLAQQDDLAVLQQNPALAVDEQGGVIEIVPVLLLQAG